MSELLPLMASGDDELELALLSSAHSDAPDALSMRDAALAVGLSAVAANALAASLPTTMASLASLPVAGGAASVTLGPASGAGAAGAGGAVASGGAALGSATFLTLGKGLVGGALVSLAALTAVDQGVRLSSSETAPASVVTAAGRAASVPVRPPVRSDVGRVSGSPSDIAAPPAEAEQAHSSSSERASAASALPRRERASSSAPAEPPARLASAPAPTSMAFAAPESAPPEPARARPQSSSLAREIRLLDQARTAALARDFAGADRLLDAYAASGPSGVLAQEAALLRVRILLGRGARHAAAELARRTIAEYPESAHADWLRDTAAER